MKKWLVLALLLGGLGLVFGVVVPYQFIHFFGIDTQQSDNYDFVSGVGPMLITAVGYGGLIGALVSHVNCHQRGCWRIGRHKVGGTPWCNTHHANARPERSEQELLESIEAKMDALVQALTAGRQ